MKTIILSGIFVLWGFTTLSAATLEASTTQAVYPGTSVTKLSIVSGSGKTSYVSGVINDPTDPAATDGIWFNAPTGSTLAFNSSNTSVVKVADITAEEIQSGLFAVRIKPSGVGIAKITVKLSGASDYTIQYAASKASAVPEQTTWLTGSSDASAICDASDDYFFVADDETNIIRLYHKSLSGMPLKEIDASDFANGSEEFDIEGATMSDDGHTVYWIASLANSKSGKEKPYRNRALSTKLTGSGASASLSAGAYSEKFRDAMIAFGDANGWDFTASASTANKMIPKRIDGFNIEGLTLKTNGGGAAYVGFRAPCVPKNGVTPTSSNRKYAVLATVTNFTSIFSGSGKSSTNVQTGDPVLFDFGGLGVRSIERVGNYYVIIAGMFDGGGTPKAYLWDGTTNANADPIAVGDHLKEMNLGMSDLVGGSEGHPEALIGRQEGNQLYLDVVSDLGSVDMYNDDKENKVYASDSKKKPWGKFRLDRFVYTLPETTGISATTIQPDFYYQVTGCQLLLSGRLANGTPVTVATLDGKVVANATVTNETCTIQLPQANAMYIVKAGEKSIKIAIHH